jgi:peptidoglycan hydrolase-like protein with peptidoglycan-binding domain
VLSQTVTIHGTVGASSTFPVRPQPATAGTGTQGASVQVLTSAHIKAGDRVTPGEVLLEVSGRPLVILRGSVPAFRDLKPGSNGADVAELQDALAGLGFASTGDTHGAFGPGTKRAVTAYYKHLGYDVPTTGGSGDIGDQDALNSAQTAEDAAQRAVDDEKSLIAAQAKQSPPPTTAPGQESEQQKLYYLNKTLTSAQAAKEELVARTGVMVPLSEVAFVSPLPATVQSFSAKVGDAVDGSKGPLLTLSTGSLGITSNADPAIVKGLLKAGMKVDVTDEALGLEAIGAISSVGDLTAPAQTAPASTANQSTGGGVQSLQTPYIPVTVTTDKPLPTQWDGQDVRLRVTAASTGTPVLVVPLSAVTTGADGKTTVSTLAPDGRTTTQIEVEPGVSADGFVAVTPSSPGALKAGDKVVVSATDTGSGTQ